MAHSLHHIALVVRDPARSAEIFRTLLDAVVIPPDAERRGPPETQVHLAGLCLVLVQGEGKPTRTDEHIAFAVEDRCLSDMEAKLAVLGLQSERARAGTSGRSLYFVDYDNHLFELNAGPRLEAPKHER